MTNLIRVEVDASELEAKIEDLEALEIKVEELTTTVEALEDHIREVEQQANLEGDDPAGTDMLAKFMTQDEIEEFVKEVLREASISIDV
tara:strand:+ start:2835 stop:3101 length:267 start_codon:yes stop_codon:yes gene_type:complete